MEIPEDLYERARSELQHLSSHLRAWAEARLIQPREVTFCSDPEGRVPIRLWLLTDHIGADDDGDQRIVFDPYANAFGVETTLIDGTEWYTGPKQGGFADTVRGL